SDERPEFIPKTHHSRVDTPGGGSRKVSPAVRRLSNIVAFSLALSIAAAPVAYAGPKKGGGAKKGNPKPAATAKEAPPSKAADPLGDVGSGGAKGASATSASGAAPQR